MGKSLQDYIEQNNLHNIDFVQLSIRTALQETNDILLNYNPESIEYRHLSHAVSNLKLALACVEEWD